MFYGLFLLIEVLVVCMCFFIVFKSLKELCYLIVLLMCLFFFGIWKLRKFVNVDCF